jgi:hypothetical protein
VEGILEKCLSEEESAGFYEGQFKELAALGRETAVPVLIAILSNPKYEFLRRDRHENPHPFERSMRELAVMALGELGGNGAVETLEMLAADERQMSPSRRLHEETLVALHLLGRKKPLEDELLDLRRRADQLVKEGAAEAKEDGCDRLFSLALLLNRLKRRAEAVKIFQEVLQVIDTFKLDRARESLTATVSYNLACMSALDGDPSTAVQWLDRAVRAGFTDRTWILMDRDLDSIRGEKDYKKLMENKELFEKKNN